GRGRPGRRPRRARAGRGDAPPPDPRQRAGVPGTHLTRDRGDRPAMNFGTFLLMQSPSARSSREIYARAIEMALTAERLGFNNIWLAEHHFSPSGYPSGPVRGGAQSGG